MANTPKAPEHPISTSAAPKAPDHSGPTIEASDASKHDHAPKTHGEYMSRAKERAERVKDVKNEQQTTSDEIEAMGVDAWRIAHDERPEAERPTLEMGQISACGGVVSVQPPGTKRVEGVAVKQPEGGKL